jgi:hypothetical protein
MKLQGLRGVDLDRISRANDQILDLANKQKAHAQNLDTGKVQVPDADPFQAILLQELDRPGSRFAGQKLDHLRKATAEEVKLAWQLAQKLGQLDGTLYHAMQEAKRLDKLSGADVTASGAQLEYHARLEVIRRIDVVLEGMVLLSAVLPDFPKDELENLRKAFDVDMKALTDTFGSSVAMRAPISAPKTSWGDWFEDPNPNALPQSKALVMGSLDTIEGAAAAIGALANDPALAKSLERIADRLGDRAGEYRALLAAYAVLLDEATSAPDYAGGAGSGDHRQQYRSRQIGGYASRNRQDASRTTLVRPLERLSKERDPIAALSEALVDGFVREVGVPPHVARDWHADPGAVVLALDGETFVPLRALNERIERWVPIGYDGAGQTLVRELTQAVVEGRYFDWRCSHGASADQLAFLDEGQKQKWLAPISIEVDAKTKGEPVKVRTTEAHADLGIFWATKVGGPSHGFDTMTNCALSLVTNARNTAILVHDPRWPNVAGRAYLRLLALDGSREPVLFLEGMHLDFPYRGHKASLEKACILHAIEKAKAMGVRLSLSESLAPLVDEMKLEGKWDNQRFVLARAALIEAASVFGQHDWVQLGEEVRMMKKAQFFVGV